MDYQFFSQFPEFDNHSVIVPVEENAVGLKGFIAIHRGRHTHALGATRLWTYASDEEALRDALRLSRLMSYKSALAGLPYGGAKAVLMNSPGALTDRAAFFRAYAKKVDELAGQFITGTDVGVSNTDLQAMRAETKYVIGNGVNSAYFTVLGVLSGIQESFKHLFGSGDIAGKTFAIQGAGKTGLELLKLIYSAAGEIFAADINPGRIAVVRHFFPKVQIVSPAEIHKQPVDVFAPCALASALNTATVLELQCRIVAGSANNQLQDAAAGDKLFSRGILYAPDYVINAGGLISVVDQFINTTHDSDRIKQQLLKIPQSLRNIFERSKQESTPTHSIADRIAAEIINRPALSAV